MNPKQELLQELETTPITIVLQLLAFLRFLKAQKPPLDFMDFAGIAADIGNTMDDLVATSERDRQQDLNRLQES